METMTMVTSGENTRADNVSRRGWIAKSRRAGIATINVGLDSFIRVDLRNPRFIPGGTLILAHLL